MLVDDRCIGYPLKAMWLGLKAMWLGLFHCCTC